jgi:ATP-dependent DNA ligase
MTTSRDLLRVMPGNRTKAKFVAPMLRLRTERLPEGPDWAYELKLDGYRAMAIKTGGEVQLRSRNDKPDSVRFEVERKQKAG